MFFPTNFTGLLALALAVTGVRAHGVLTAVTGANGLSGQGFGVIASTPRDGTKRNPFQQDTSIIRDNEVSSGKAGACGRTLAGGNNDVTTQLNAAVSAGLPSASADGTVSMTLHQVNADGAGPYTCEVSTDATGANFAAMTVTTNVPGKNSLSTAKATDFPLVAQMPAGATCTGGANGNACLVRCRNSAIAGPFGGCAAVTDGSSNATSAGAASASAADVSATAAAADIAAAAGASAINTATAVGGASAAASDAATADGGATATGAAAGAAATAPSAAGAAAAGAGSSAGGKAGKAGKAADVKSKVKSALGLRRLRRASTRGADVEGGDTQPGVSAQDADAALAADLDRRLDTRLERMRRSRVVGRRGLGLNDD